MHQQRQTGTSDMRQCRSQLLLRDHSEPLDARMYEETFETRHSRVCQRLDLALVVSDYSAPSHPIDSAALLCCSALRTQGRNRSSGWQAIEWHIHQQRVSSGGRRASCRLESFPFRPPRIIYVHMRIYQSGKNRCFAKIQGLSLRGNLLWSNHLPDAFSIHEDGGWTHSLRCHYPAGEKGAQIHVQKELRTECAAFEARA